MLAHEGNAFAYQKKHKLRFLVANSVVSQFRVLTAQHAFGRGAPFELLPALHKIQRIHDKVDQLGWRSLWWHFTNSLKCRSLVNEGCFALVADDRIRISKPTCSHAFSEEAGRTAFDPRRVPAALHARRRTAHHHDKYFVVASINALSLFG